MKANTNTINSLRQILIIAKIKGEWLRFPQRFEAKPNIGGMVGLAMQDMDDNDIPWSVQNKALAYINDVDLPEVWQSLFKRQYDAIVRDLI